MIPIAYLLYAVFAEAIIFWIIFDINRPEKDIRENLKKFAAENDISVQSATDWILRSFFKAYENGLKEKMIEKRKPKLIVKPRKKGTDASPSDPSPQS